MDKMQDMYIFGQGGTGKTTRMLLEAVARLETHRFYQEPIKAAADARTTHTGKDLLRVADVMADYWDNLAKVRVSSGLRIICDNSPLQALWYLSRDMESTPWRRYHRAYKYHTAKLREDTYTGKALLYVQEGECEEFAIENGFTVYEVFKPYRL